MRNTKDSTEVSATGRNSETKIISGPDAVIPKWFPPPKPPRMLLRVRHHAAQQLVGRKMRC